MKLTLVKKADASDKDPLIIHFVKDNMKVTQKVAVGEVIDLPDETAYEVLAKYKGMFKQGAAAQDQDQAVDAKSLKGYANKAVHAKAEKAETNVE